MKIKQTKYGRGVFSTKSYSIGDLIENSPVIVISKEDTEKIDETLLYDYYFAWGKNDDQSAIALGNGSLFNHSYLPNAKYLKNKEKETIEFIAVRPIKNGEEILINYNGDPNSKKPLWFNADPKY